MAGLAFDGSQVGPPIGYFTYTVAEDHWAWSDGLYAIHGYAPHEVTPSTETMLRHKHPDDVARALEVLETAVSHGRPFSCYHRIIDRRGEVRSVLSLGRSITDPDGRVECLTGFFADLTAVRRAEAKAELDAVVVDIARRRAVIEQAKGMVMFALGCDADAAFALLRRYSSTTNLKLHDVALLLTGAGGRGLRADEPSGAALLAVLEDLMPAR
jgi:PAS domain S-box-containing protein